VAFVVANEGVERAEPIEPWKALQAAGAQPVLAATKAEDVQLFEHLDPAESWTATKMTSELTTEHFDALVLPGGVANADQLRLDTAAVHFVGEMVRAGA
jgi:protease I